MQPLRTVLIALVSLVSLLGMTACGDDGEKESGKGAEEAPATPSGPAVATVAVRETEYELDPSDPDVAESGVVEFRVENAGEIDHALEVEGPDGEAETETIAPGKSATLKVDLKPGTYEWYCPIADHKDRGMKGEVTVAVSGADAGGSAPETGEEAPSGGGY